MLSSGGSLQVPKPQFPSLNSPQRAANTNGTERSRKVALAPGHSLMDWVRLGQTKGRSLNGVDGQIRHVTVDELARHNKVDDAWMSIRGKVYNVTPYMSFHPGGEDEMMRGVGGDGTSLFDDVHQWVNVASMLEKCFVGPLSKTIQITSAQPKELRKRIENLKTSSPTKVAPSSSGSDSSSKTAFEEPFTVDHPKPKARYDWYQNGGKITITIYAKCKSVKAEHLVIDRIQRNLRASLLLDDHVYTMNVCLSEDITDTYEGIRVITGPIFRVMFVLNKKDPDVKWVSLGTPLEGNNAVIPRTEKEPAFRPCKVVTCRPLTHDIKLLSLQLPYGCHMSIPMGYHVYLRVNVNDTEISRPYTAVSSSLLPENSKDSETNGRIIHLMIKTYADGQLTQHVARLQEGDTIEVSDYEGSFVESRLQQTDRLTLLAAGTGFTPMVNLIHWSLVQQKRKPEQIKLVFFNKTEGDIPWRNELTKLTETNRHFEVVNVLSEPDHSWAGPKGRIRKELVEDFMSQPSQNPNEKFLVCICGPTPFTQLAYKLTKAYGYTDDMINVFAA